MKLIDLKKMLDKLSPAQLQQELLYNSAEYSISGVASVIKTKANLYNPGDDDPCELKTKKELQSIYDAEEIKEMDIEIPKGSIVITF